MSLSLHWFYQRQSLVHLKVYYYYYITHLYIFVIFPLNRCNPKRTLMLNEEVRRIMTKDCVTAHPEDSLTDVANMMFERRVYQVPVTEGKILVGMITARDLWKLSMQSDMTDNMKVKDAMTTSVIMITPKDKVGTAAELFMDKRFKTLPVVNLRHELKGVITAFNVIRHTLTREYPHPILYSEVFEELQEKAS